MYTQILGWLKYIILIGIFCLICYFGWLKIVRLETENQRHVDNISKMHLEHQVEKTINGELKYTIDALTIKGNELKHFDSALDKKLANIDVKLRNLQSVSNLSYSYITKIDTVKSVQLPSEPLSYNVRRYSTDFTQNYIQLKSVINVPKDTLYPPYLSNINIKFEDTLLIVGETLYKRRWIFWKRPTGVKIHVKSENPMFNLDRIQTYQFTK